MSSLQRPNKAARVDEISVRGIKGGVLIILPEKPWYLQRAMLISRIQAQERFFKGGRIAVDVGGTDWLDEQLVKLLRDLSDEGVCLWAILTRSEVTLATARNFELQTKISAQNTPEEQKPTQMAQHEIDFEWHTKPLEKGEKIVFRADGAVIGDVPSGVEVVAAGSLIVWGEVGGNLKVGCGGDTASRLFALRFAGGMMSLCGQPVEVPKKLTKAGPFEIRIIDDRCVINESVARKMKFL